MWLKKRFRGDSVSSLFERFVDGSEEVEIVEPYIGGHDEDSRTVRTGASASVRLVTRKFAAHKWPAIRNVREHTRSFVFSSYPIPPLHLVCPHQSCLPCVDQQCGLHLSTLMLVSYCRHWGNICRDDQCRTSRFCIPHFCVFLWTHRVKRCSIHKHSKAKVAMRTNLYIFQWKREHA